MEAVEVALAEATKFKAEGAALFAAGRHADALDKYLAAVAAVAPTPSEEEGRTASANLYGWPQLEETAVASRSNAALCYLKLGCAADALAQSDAGLELAVASSLVSLLRPPTSLDDTKASRVACCSPPCQIDTNIPLYTMHGNWIALRSTLQPKLHAKLLLRRALSLEQLCTKMKYTGGMDEVRRYARRPTYLDDVHEDTDGV